MKLWLAATCITLGLVVLGAAQPSSTAAPAVGWVAGGDEKDPSFIPATRRERGRVVLPVTFTDGTRAELLYPRRLALAELGVVPYGSGTLQGQSPTPGRGDEVGRDFLVRYDDVDDFTASWELLGRYTGADGQEVGFWDSGPGESDSNYLGFQFGSWAVLVYDFPSEFDGGAASMTDAERAAWAHSFSGRETPGGFLRLDATDPLRLDEASDHAGPRLAFGGLAGPLTLTLGPCRRTSDQDRDIHGKRVSWSRGLAGWCVARSMRADARGSRRFRRALIRSLTVRPAYMRTYVRALGWADSRGR